MAQTSGAVQSFLTISIAFPSVPVTQIGSGITSLVQTEKGNNRYRGTSESKKITAVVGSSIKDLHSIDRNLKDETTLADDDIADFLTTYFDTLTTAQKLRFRIQWRTRI